MHRRAHIALGLGWIMALATALVDLFVHLGSHAWQTDEPVYRNAAHAIFDHGNWSHNLEHPLVGKYLIGISQLAFGDAAWATRLPSAIATLLCGLVLAALAARILRGSAAAPWAGLMTFVTWTLLPHPDPTFDVARLGYLDAPLALFLACTLYCAWRWQESWSWRWCMLAGVAGGLAVGTKIPALFLAVAVAVVVIGRDDTSRRTRALQLVSLWSVAAVTALLAWLPLGRDLPEALRFLVAMQRRDVNQTLEVAGRTYHGNAPIWTQAWWQWNAWPDFALVQLAAIMLAWWLLPRRATLLIGASVLIPALAYAIGPGRILPHWQVTWQPAMAVLVGLVFTSLSARHPRPIAVVVVAAASASILFHAGVRTHEVVTMERSESQRVYALLRDVDQHGNLVAQRPECAVRVDRLLIEARFAARDTVYHPAGYSQHRWVTRDGGTTVEPRYRSTEIATAMVLGPELSATPVPAGRTCDSVERLQRTG